MTETYRRSLGHLMELTGQSRWCIGTFFLPHEDVTSISALAPLLRLPGPQTWKVIRRWQAQTSSLKSSQYLKITSHINADAVVRLYHIQLISTCN